MSRKYSKSRKLSKDDETYELYILEKKVFDYLDIYKVSDKHKVQFTEISELIISDFSMNFPKVKNHKNLFIIESKKGRPYLVHLSADHIKQSMLGTRESGSMMSRKASSITTTTIDNFERGPNSSRTLKR